MKAEYRGEWASITIRIPKSLIVAIKKSAVAERRSINDQLVVLLEKCMTKEAEKKKS